MALDCGADADFFNKDLESPLLLVADLGYTSVARTLLENGASANLHITTKRGQSPLLAAAQKSHEDTVALLLEHGALLDQDLSPSSSKAMIFGLSSNQNIAVLLLDNGANVNIVHPGSGVTALHRAAKKGNAELVDLLLARGANSSATLLQTSYGPEGATPLELAELSGHAAAMARLLQEEEEEEEEGSNTDRDNNSGDNEVQVEGTVTFSERLADYEIRAKAKGEYFDLAESDGGEDDFDYLEVVKVVEAPRTPQISSNQPFLPPFPSAAGEVSLTSKGSGVTIAPAASLATAAHEQLDLAGALKVLRGDGRQYITLSPALRYHREVAFAAFKLNGQMLKYSPSNVKNDKELVMRAVK